MEAWPVRVSARVDERAAINADDLSCDVPRLRSGQPPQYQAQPIGIEDEVHSLQDMAMAGRRRKEAREYEFAAAVAAAEYLETMRPSFPPQSDDAADESCDERPLVAQTSRTGKTLRATSRRTKVVIKRRLPPRSPAPATPGREDAGGEEGDAEITSFSASASASASASMEVAADEEEKEEKEEKGEEDKEDEEKEENKKEVEENKDAAGAAADEEKKD